MPTLTLHDAVGAALAEEMRRDSTVIAFGEGIATKRRELAEEFGTRRIRNTPLSEGIIAGTAAGAAAGSSPSATIVGTGTDFRVTLTTGTTATSSGVLFTVTLPVTYPTGTIVTVTNGDSDSAAHAVRVFTTSTTSTVVLNATASALSDATAYIWNFHVAGY